MDDYRTRIDALEQTWQVWAEVGAGLTEQQWRTPSRCAGWDVAALYAHHGATPLDLAKPFPDTDAPGNPVTATEIVRGFNEPTGLAHTMAEPIRDHTVQLAASLSRQELADRFAGYGPRAVGHLRQARGDLVGPWPSGVVTSLAEGMRILLMEATVHLLDVLRALELPPNVPSGALVETARFLAEIAPPVAFIEAATGRSGDSPLPILR